DQFLAPWLLTHFKGQKRPQYWAIREAYTGQKPDNYPPRVEYFKLTNEVVGAEDWIPIQLSASDKENEELSVSFVYNQRSGSRKRRDQLLALNHRGDWKAGFEIEMPDEQGAIKVYACVNDTYQNVGIASTSVKVQSKKGNVRKYLVPKVSLPFYVYREGKENDYISSGHMGNYQSMEIDLENKEEVFEGKSSLRIVYEARENWYGVGFVDPPGDWGNILGGYDISGAKTFSFYAKAEGDKVYAKIGFGLIDTDKPYPDTAKKYKEVTLTSEWKKYKINIGKLDLSCIRSGLVVFSSSRGFPHKIYLDNVVFE
ncbi:MAG: hypothetical protein HRT61_20815, partial [Ekhidna sp.]|nr:hypothetical protein [Ekhidna sp.]